MIKYLGKSVVSHVYTVWSSSNNLPDTFSMRCKHKKYFSTWVMLRHWGSSNHNWCTFPPGLQNENMYMGIKSIKSLLYCFCHFRKNQKAWSELQQEEIFKSTAGYHYQNESWGRSDSWIRARAAKRYQRSFCVLKGDFLRCLWPGANKS